MHCNRIFFPGTKSHRKGIQQTEHPYYIIVICNDVIY
jgi:hypothetical protein